MTTRHKHADCIIAWAEGKEIQFFEPLALPAPRWRDIQNPSWNIDLEYRVKPTTLKYRVALVQRAGAETWTINKKEDEPWLERQATFVRWVSDWQEVEV